MIGRRVGQIVIFAAIVVGVVGVFWLRPRAPRPAAPRPASASPATAPSPGPTNMPAGVSGPSNASAPADGTADPAQAGESHLADDLNAPTGTIQRDLSILDEVFTAFQTNFPRTGNPVGENAEITAALTGDNPFKFAFIPRRHRAINASGELSDRWGTPFRFHQLSGHQMEIRSAGPDRKFGTPDDVELSKQP